jgi:APA family basic amino acid/polyamine antiporter
MVSIGTLLAFVIVSAGVWILRRRSPELKRPFKAPWVPFTPIMGIMMSLGLMLTLTAPTWIRLGVWLIVGLLIYFFYGSKHSRVQRAGV